MQRFFVLLIVALALFGAACQPETTGPRPVAPELQLLVLPDDGLAPVLGLIDGAQESVRFKIYLLKNDETIAALAAAANRGVDVQVLIEQSPVGGGESNEMASGRLREAGVQARWAPATFQLTHEKSLVVDGKLALVGTFNYTNSSFANNREYGLLTTDPILVDEIVAIFDADWAGKPYDRVRNPALVVSPLNSRAQIEALIDTAQKSLWLQENTLLDEAIANRLIAAVQRGVEVRFLGPLRTDEEDLAEPNYRRLQSAGAQVARISAPYVHAKMIVADGKKALVGSINLSRASMDLNRELGMTTTDAAIIARLQETFENDWQLARQVSPAPAGAIGWQDAGKYLGAEVTVEGEIVRTHDTGKVTFLNFTPNYRGALTLVIFASDYDKYPAPPVDYFLDKRVRATGRVKEYQGAPEIIIESPGQIEIVAGAAAQPSPAPLLADAPAAPATVVSTPSPTPALAPAVVGWQDANDFMDETITVEGRVMRAHDTGKVTFLNFTNEWQGTFSVVIFASDYDKFPQPPAALFRGQVIRVSGRVKEYQGAPEMVVESPDAIAIIEPGQGDGEATAETTAEAIAPATAPTTAPAGVIPWEQAGDYLDQTVTVSGRIVRAADAGSITFLNFSRERGQFVVVIFADDYTNFPSPPAEMYQDKSIWVTGEVTEYNGAPQIVVHSPDQIEVFP